VSPSPANLRKQQLLDLPVTGLAFGGKGLARVNDFVVFVSGGVPGDVARVRLTRLKKRYAEGRVEELVTPSPDRVAARCPGFGGCGGCSWQDLAYDAQLRYKAQQVRESLEHLGGLSGFTLRPILGMADPWRYRNRVDFAIGDGPDGAVIGFRPPGRWDTVAPVAECHLLTPSLEAVRTTVERWLRDAGLPGWDPRAQTGYARHLVVRSARLGAELLVILVTAPGDLPDSSELAERLRAAHPETVGVVHAVNAGRAEVSTGLDWTILWGRPFLLEQVAGLTLKISVNAFFQTNTLMAHALYELAADEAGVGGGDAGADPGAPVGPGTSAAASGRVASGPAAGSPVIWDLYSGVGSIGLALAKRGAAVLGIEAVPSAVKDAQENARLNGLAHVRFVQGDVRQVLREVAQGRRTLPSGFERPDVIVVDPPRAGLHRRVVDRIGELGPSRIVYVSCNPTTMAPNVAQLGQYGYRLEHVTPVDMFPHTPHVECVGMLARAG
jgi:23S rRNA (uracil1939-C5)-methyltransferase